MRKIDLTPFFIKTVVTFLGVGYLPFIPGTFASAVGIVIFLLIKNNILLHSLLFFFFLLAGFLLSGKAEKLFKCKDYPSIIIDEVSGMLLSLLFIPFDLKLVMSGFLIFRILDALKPYPADKIQNISGSIGIMGDDIIAGLYTNVILQLISRCK